MLGHLVLGIPIDFQMRRIQCEHYHTISTYRHTNIQGIIPEWSMIGSVDLVLVIFRVRVLCLESFGCVQTDKEFLFFFLIVSVILFYIFTLLLIGSINFQMLSLTVFFFIFSWMFTNLFLSSNKMGMVKAMKVQSKVNKKEVNNKYIGTDTFFLFFHLDSSF